MSVCVPSAVRSVFTAWLAAILVSACAFETNSSSPLAPSEVSNASQVEAAPVAHAAALLGTWTSQSLTELAGSCTNVTWSITSQSENALTGELSADCAGGLSVRGTITGTLVGQEVPYTVTGVATLAGIACPVTLTGTARLEGDAIRIPYDGASCAGPIRGEELLRRPTEPAPAPEPEPAPAPAPQPTPEPAPPAVNPHHVGAGPLSAARAEQVVMAAGREFPHLIAAKGTADQSLAASLEMLRRMIWHLRLAGFEAGRQKNPSGAISGDKLTVFADGRWRAYDVFYDVGRAGKATQIIFKEVFPANPVADGGIPD